MKKITKIGGAIAIGAALMGTGMIGGFVLDNPETIHENITTTITEYVDVPVIEYVNQTVEVEVIKNVTEEVIVEVDNGNLDVVLEEIYDNDGRVSYLIDDLDEDEISQIVERIAFANDVKALAVAHVKAELADELDNEEIILADNSTYKFDEDDFEKIRIDDDSDEIELSNIDYEELDSDVTVTGRFRHDDKWFTFEADIEVESMFVEDMDLDVTEE